MATTVVPTLRSSDELVKRIQRTMRDRDAQRWTKREILLSINEAVFMWRNRVSIPYMYMLTGGWQAGIYEYAIPSYIDAQTAEPQAKSLYPYALEQVFGNEYQWFTLSGFTIEPDSTGQKLRINVPPNNWNENDARILWYAANGPLPEVDVKLSAVITSSDTSATVTVTDSNDELTPLHDYGYIKINNEWMQYVGVSRGATITLSNLTRGMFETTAAAHSADDTVHFGLGAVDSSLWMQLEYHARAALHRLFLTDASDNDTAHHERLMQYYQEQADAYWMTYTPARSARLRTGRRNLELMI